MNEFDQYIKHTLKAKHYIRYADDFVIIDSHREYLKQLLPDLTHSLNQDLKLELHPKKVSISTFASGIDFLGWVHFPYHRVLRTVTKRRMFNNLEKKEYDNQSTQSYLGMLKHGNGYKLTSDILKEKPD